jgi:hypothetical protein
MSHSDHKTTELKALQEAVRKHSKSKVLLHLVGPSEEESAEADKRLRRTDLLTPACRWGDLVPGSDAMEARACWLKLLKTQTSYEERYC